MTRAQRTAFSLLRGLTTAGLAPTRLELAAVAGGYFAAASSQNEPLKPISEAVTTGFSRDAAVATTKALTEWAERAAILEGARRGERSCLTARSDGMAAFPRAAATNFQVMRRARYNAYCEALERYVWSVWWDDFSVLHQTTSADNVDSAHTLLRQLLAACGRLIPVKDIQVVMPLYSDSAFNSRVVVLVANLKSGGVVSAGAAASDRDNGIWERAGAELYRHFLALSRISTRSNHSEQFYERRLAFFGFGAGSELVRERLSRTGTSRVALPRLDVDEEVNYSCSHIVYAHRCLFAGQPPFIGGALERLCI